MRGFRAGGAGWAMLRTLARCSVLFCCTGGVTVATGKHCGLVEKGSRGHVLYNEKHAVQILYVVDNDTAEHENITGRVFSTWPGLRTSPRSKRPQQAHLALKLQPNVINNGGGASREASPNQQHNVMERIRETYPAKMVDACSTWCERRVYDFTHCCSASSVSRSSFLSSNTRVIQLIICSKTCGAELTL